MTAETPEPVDSQVTFDAAGTTVHGTLTRPATQGPHPAVLLIAGSGPTDRDWNNPMLPGDNGSAALLASRLAKRNVVTLRYDKRGTGKTAMPSEPLTWEQYLQEQRAALKLLASSPHVRPDAIFVAGHSEGGAHALKLIERPETPLRGVLLLSTAGRSLATVVESQIRANLTQGGLPPAQIDDHCAKLADAFAAIARGDTVNPTDVSPFPGVQQLIVAFQNPLSGTFPRDILPFDPQQALAQATIPVFLLGGGKDIQIDDKLDVVALHEAAKQAGLADVELVIAPEADHVLKRETLPRAQLTGAVVGPRYNASDRDLDPVVVEAIAAWIAKHTP